MPICLRRSTVSHAPILSRPRRVRAQRKRVQQGSALNPGRGPATMCTSSQQSRTRIGRYCPCFALLCLHRADDQDRTRCPCLAELATLAHDTRVMTTKKRRYDFELAPFAGGPVECVQVMAVNRGFAFSLAVAQAIDPNNIWKARLMRDGGERLDPDNFDARMVPSGYESIARERMQIAPGTTLRLYHFDVTLFGGVWTSEGTGSCGRVHAFTQVVFDTAPDSVVEVGLRSIVEVDERGGGPDRFLDPSKKYGGVTFDLNDPPGPSMLYYPVE